VLLKRFHLAEPQVMNLYFRTPNTPNCTVIGLTRERFVALGLPSWTHLRARYWSVLHCKELEDLLRALGLRYCEGWEIGENEKVKADSTTERCFS